MVRFTPARLFGLLVALTALALAAFALCVRFGEQPISLLTALSDPTSSDATIFWALRLPHAVLAAIVGAALATSGTALQSLMRNPLADPFVLGVSGGAALGATLAIALGLGKVGDLGVAGPASALANLSAPSLFAFAGSAGAIALVFAISRVQGQTSTYAALLSGVIFNAFASAAITCVKTLTSRERLGEILYWLVGTLGYERGWTLAGAALLQVAAIGLIWANAAHLNALTLGDEDAASLGVEVARTRRALLLATSLSVAGAVALSGLVGFVGLIVPHVLRLWLGPDNRLLVPCSALGGAAFLMGSDLVARLLFRLVSQEVPVGVVTALVGGPFFLVLLRRRQRLPA
ncbi:MAG TPA: iron ABC transporter permease [Myxococcaceae bacterium]|jgi:iron complex transport system permease protein